MSKLQKTDVSVLSRIQLSARELSVPSSLAICGMLLALRVVLGYFANFTQVFILSVKIGFNFLPIAIAALLFGPVAACIVGGAGDMLSFFLNPQGGAYFPGWTISGIIAGFIYGLFLYKKRVHPVRIVLCLITTGIFVELLLGTVWLYLQYSFPFAETLLTRSLTLLIKTPVEIAVLILVFGAIKKIKPVAVHIQK